MVISSVGISKTMGSIRVQVIQQQTGTFADFDGYAGEEPTDVTSEHDAWGVDVE